MQAACVHCGVTHTLNDSEIGSRPKVQFRCAKCDGLTVVEIKRSADSTIAISPLPSFALADGTDALTKLKRQPLDGLQLPEQTNVVIRVLSGPSKGLVYKLVKPRITIGRKGSDVPLQDPEVSRHHCVIEAKGKAISLKDLDSTNGIFMEDERVRAAVLMDGSEFRIGSSVIRLNFEPK